MASFYSSQRCCEMDKTITRATSFQVRDFCIFSTSVLHDRVIYSWVWASESGLHFLTVLENLRHMVFSGKHQYILFMSFIQCLLNEQHEVAYHASLRSLMIKLHGMKHQSEMKLADHSSNHHIPKTTKPEDVISSHNYYTICTRHHETCSLIQTVKNESKCSQSISASQGCYLKSHLKSDLENFSDEQETL